MRKVIPLNIGEGYNPSVHRQANNTQLYNFYISVQSGKPMLFPTPGYEAYSTYNFGNNARGLFESKLFEGLIIVYDTLVYGWGNDAGSPSLLNVGLPLTTQTGKVYISENFDTQIALSDGVSLYIYTVNTGKFEKATLPDGVTPGMVDYQDSYFILQNKNTKSWYISDFNNGKVWSSTDFTLANSTLMGLAVLNRQVVILGKAGGNVYYNVGNADFPYQRDNNIPIPYGCLAPQSIAVAYGSLIWLGISTNNQPVLLKMTGGMPEILSLENITTLLSQLTAPEECEAFLYQMNGHTFYQINFREDNLSLLFDFNTGIFIRVTENAYTLSRVKYLSTWKQGYFCLLDQRSFLYEFSPLLSTQERQLVPRTWITSHLNFRNKNFSVSKLQVYLSQGMQERNPTTSQCTLRISHDLGVTFPIMRAQNMSPLGDRRMLFNFYKLGTNRNWTFQFQFLTDAEVVLMGADCEAVFEANA